MSYKLLIDGQLVEGSQSLPVINPATGKVFATCARANEAQALDAIAAAKRAFGPWSALSHADRQRHLDAFADGIEDRQAEFTELLTKEQGKPVREAIGEVIYCAMLFEFYAGECKRTYGRQLVRPTGQSARVIYVPVGPVAGFAAWNFPAINVARKIGGAIAAGCSVIVKPSEETPAAGLALVQALLDAGVPGDVCQVVFGVPDEVSRHLLASPIIRKVTFTGSTAVGKHLTKLAADDMKVTTMELGGHAPALVFDDADVEQAARLLVGSKFRNAGQVCVSPTRFLIQRGVFETFLERFVALAREIKVGNGLDPDVTMGPLANERRRPALEALIDDARSQGATVQLGGKGSDGPGYFFEPTVLTGLTPQMRAMNEEPFGPLALLVPFDDLEEALAEANRLPFGLAAYAFTASSKTAQALSDRLEAGMLTINHLGIALPELPFGGIKDSGYGSEGGSEALEAYLTTKLVTHMG